MDQKRTSLHVTSNYNQKAEVQDKFVALLIEQQIKKKIGQLDLRTIEHISIADYGCAGGLNSSVYLKEIVDALLEQKNSFHFTIYLIDLPGNDFTITKQVMNQQFKNFSQIEFKYIENSFYNQLFQDNQIDIGVCCTALHWLSKVPNVPLEHQLVHTTDDGVGENEAWKENAHNDLVQFLTHRQKELKKNSLMFIGVNGGQWCGNYSIFTKKYFDEALSESGLSKIKEYVNFPIINRSEKEFKDAFNDERIVGKFSIEYNFNNVRTTIDSAIGSLTIVINPYFQNLIIKKAKELYDVDMTPVEYENLFNNVMLQVKEDMSRVWENNDSFSYYTMFFKNM